MKIETLTFWVRVWWTLQLAGTFALAASLASHCHYASAGFCFGLGLAAIVGLCKT